MKRNLFVSGMIAIALAGCGKNNFLMTNNNFSIPNGNFNSYQRSLSLNDFNQVCNGSINAEAAAYDKSSGTVSPVAIYFQPNAQANFRDIDSVSLDNFPNEGQSNYWAHERTQLVACVTIKEVKMGKKCDYKDDKNGKSYQLTKYDAKYNFKVYEAKTGNIVADQDFNLKAENECAYFESFSLEQATKNPDYKQTLANFLKPLVKH